MCRLVSVVFLMCRMVIHDDLLFVLFFAPGIIHTWRVSVLSALVVVVSISVVPPCTIFT
jgi:hypothetical protein